MTKRSEMEQKFLSLLDEFEHAMLVTLRGSELRCRPMAIADRTEDGCLRFITRDDSAKLKELDDFPNVNVALQKEGKFLSISGAARLSKDDSMIDAVWQARQAAWFADGKDDPHVIVLEVVPTHAEYWDRSATGVLELVLKKGRALVSDDDSAARADSADIHGDIDFRRNSA